MSLLLCAGLVFFLLWIEESSAASFLSLIGGGTVIYWMFVSLMEIIS